ncbi:hypothetical protein DYI41_06250 [Marinobacter salarius]|jgi:hypothetical protein|nr:hypothetical protein [Marinobacter salarius]
MCVKQFIHCFVTLRWFDRRADQTQGHNIVGFMGILQEGAENAAEEMGDAAEEAGDRVEEATQ